MSNSSRSSTTSSSLGGAGAYGATTLSTVNGWRGHPRWRLKSFLSRDAEASRDANGSSAGAASATAGTVAADSNADSLTGLAMTAAPLSLLPDGEPDGAPAAAESPRPRKGDVVCLSYRTLDDRGMRRLEGRSDHRPVIGVYAIYV